MSAARDHLLSMDGRRIGTQLADLGVNAGRMQREDGPAHAQACAYRVIIDVQANGEFTVYSDPDVQVVCRCAHIPEDELVRVSHHPIREEWLQRRSAAGETDRSPT